jgi:hypothetical protein
VNEQDPDPESADDAAMLEQTTLGCSRHTEIDVAGLDPAFGATPFGHQRPIPSGIRTPYASYTI